MPLSNNDSSDVPSDVWCAVAGISASRIPTIGSYVYYFPQGHLEDSDLHLSNSTKPMLCKVLSVRFLCSHVSDQAFLKFVLVRVVNPSQRQIVGGGSGGIVNNNDVQNDEYSDVAMFSKVLTPSDANNGGGFSVPRFCADSIFPPLDYSADPPVQTLKMRDVVSGDVDWKFRHIYRGTPRRHLLTSGWSKFVNGKKLVAGDSVVFMRRKSTSELIIGLRRDQRSAWTNDEMNSNVNAAPNDEVANGLAGFEVVYFPRSGVPAFVVSADLVDQAMAMGWYCGMKVKMPVEEEDSSRTTWYNGTIEEVRPLIEGSPWQMLKVIWDEPHLLANTQRVSPWQVKCAMPHEEGLHSIFPPHKMLKDPTMLLSICEQQPEFAMSFKSNFTRLIKTGNPGFMSNYDSTLLPSGIQGARLATSQSLSSTTSWTECCQQSFTELLTSGVEPESGPNTGISTVLNLGSTSPLSQCSVHNFSASPCEPSTPIQSSIQLFGKTIHFEIQKNVGGMNAAYYKRV